MDVVAWEAELSHFLNHLVSVQEDTLSVLDEKRRLLAKVDTVGLAELGQREQDVIGRLQQCLVWREELLKRASAEGHHADCVESLAKSLPVAQNRALLQTVQLARGRARLLQHQSLTNWLLAQRSLLHVSQMLEIIATGGRLQPTYGKDGPTASTGSLVDRAA